MRKSFLLLFLALPLYCHGQSYAGSPFYRLAGGIPSGAHVEGWSHGSTKANGVLIDLSELVDSSSRDFDEIRGWSLHSWVDRKTPAAKVFHYYLQYDQLHVVYGYDLLVEPISGTDEVRCTFSSLTDPEDLKGYAGAWPRDKSVPVVPLGGDLKPVVMKSGGVIAITTLPLGEGRASVVHYLRLTRMDLVHDADPAEPAVGR